MIKVSDLAKEKASQLMKEEGFNPETDYIRVGVKSGGIVTGKQIGRASCRERV